MRQRESTYSVTWLNDMINYRISTKAYLKLLIQVRLGLRLDAEGRCDDDRSEMYQKGWLSAIHNPFISPVKLRCVEYICLYLHSARRTLQRGSSCPAAPATSCVEQVGVDAHVLQFFHTLSRLT